MGITHWSKPVLTIALLCLNSINHAGAESTLVVDMATLSLGDKSRDFSATLSIDGNDLFNMPKFTFTEMGEDESSDAVVYTKTKATSRIMDSGAEEVAWHGVIAETGRVGFATLVRVASGNVVGTFTTELATYELIKMPDGNLHVRSIYWDDLTESSDGKEEDQLFLEEGASSRTNNGIAAVDSFRRDTSGTITSSTGEGATMMEHSNRQLLRDGGERILQENVVIDVLVIITNRAMCEFAGLSYGCESTDDNKGPINEKIPVLEAQTNSAMQVVGDAVEVRIVEVIHLAADGFDGRPTGSTLDVISNDLYIQQWRNDSGADLVAMLTGSNDPNIFGSETFGISALNSFESAVSALRLSAYTFTHELGHNLGKSSSVRL
jgi:Metallo-peptidase family M12B Reprolysin-like